MKIIMKNHDHLIKHHQSVRVPFNGAARRWVLLVAVCTFTSIALATGAWAQTCLDGCFFSNTYQGDDALAHFGSGGNNSAFGSQALTNNTGTDNTAIGVYTLLVNTDGSYNTALGSNALYNSNGYDNTATGAYALASNTGDHNTASGAYALYSNIGGYQNTATGYFALYSNYYGDSNNASGAYALFLNTTGSYNTASGSYALYSNTTGFDNNASGYYALFSNTTGSYNNASGASALFSNTTGSYNTASGLAALYSNTAGHDNMASGINALSGNTTGNFNTGIGSNALGISTTGNSNAAVGNNALVGNTTGSSNIALGNSAGSLLTTGSNNIDIGHMGVAGESKTIRIGTKGTQTATYIAGISGKTVAGGIGVVIDSNGHLGTTTSSARFKDNIQPMEKASEAILSLEPVTFHYKHELDPDGIPQFGLVAEKVARVDPNLVVRDEEGKPYSVRYEAVNAMLLNEFLKEHRRVEQQAAAMTEMKSSAAKQDATAARLESMLEQQQGEIAALTSQLRSMKTGFETSKASSPLVARNP